MDAGVVSFLPASAVRGRSAPAPAPPRRGAQLALEAARGPRHGGWGGSVDLKKKKKKKTAGEGLAGLPSCPPSLAITAWAVVCGG